MSKPILPPGTGPGGATKEQQRIAQRRDLLPYNAKVRDEQRFGTGARTELKSMFYSGGTIAVGVHTKTADQAGDEAGAFYREHAGELDELYKRGYGAADAARALGRKYGVRFFR